jgi:peptidoglycan/LPS O-acetylase OafA/YrhL
MGLELIPAPPTEKEESIRRHMLTFPRLLEVWAGAVAAILLKTPPPWLGKDLTLLGLLAASLTLLVGGYLMGGRESIYVASHGLFAPLGILLVAGAFHNRGHIYRLCQHPVIVFGSQISILIWMLHIPVDTILKHLAIRLGVNQDTLNSWPFAATSMVATLLTASLANAIPWRAIAAKAKRESPVPAAG